MRKESATIDDLLKVVDVMEKTGITYWIDGGWGVDLLYGKQTREHRDIDVDFDAKYIDILLRELAVYGYRIDTDERPVRIELYSEKYGYLDIHPFILNGDGTSRQADPFGGYFEFERDFFGSAEFKGRKIPCISLTGQRAFHTGYELREKDKHDIALLDEIGK